MNDEKKLENQFSNLLRKQTEEFVENLLKTNLNERYENLLLDLTFLIKNLTSKYDKSIQKIIYYTLTEKGIKGILNEINNGKIEKIRKLSVQFLINLLNNNSNLQNHFCELFNFTPITNVICINFLPKIFKEKIILNEDILYEIRKSQNIINPNLKYWMWPYNEKYTKDNFPDPEKYLIGFYLENKTQIFFPEKKLSKIINIKEIIDILEREKTKNKISMIKKSNRENNLLLSDRIHNNLNERLFTTRENYRINRKLCKSLDYQNNEFKEFLPPSTFDERKIPNNNNLKRRISIEKKIPPSIRSNIVIRYKTLTVKEAENTIH